MKKQKNNRQQTDANSGDVSTQNKDEAEINEPILGKNKPEEGISDVSNKDKWKTPKEESAENGESPEESNYEEIISRLQEELQASRNSVLRKAAEFDNLKKRTQKERLLIYEDAKVDAVLKFLSIREDLKRTLEMSRNQKIDERFLKGLELVLGNFDQVLDQYGLEPIEETGIPFDVDKHDAMLSQPASDKSIESNTVIQILEPGYKIGERVIRHAKVIVSQ